MTPRTEPAVLAVFVARVLKQSPRLTHFLERRIFIAAVESANRSKN